MSDSSTRGFRSTPIQCIPVHTNVQRQGKSLINKTVHTFFPNPGLIRPLLLGSLDGNWVGDGDETGGEGDGDGDFGCSLSPAESS